MATSGGPVLLEKQGRSRRRRIPTGALIRKDAETPLFDGLGSERTVTNAGQSVATSLTLSAFGQTEASTGSSTSAYRYGATGGHRTGGDAGLTLMGCRFYNAQVERFITRDTYLDQKPYAYCDGDPVNATDPSGHGAGVDTGTLLGVLATILIAEVVAVATVGVILTAPVIIAVVIVVVVIGVIGVETGSEYGNGEADKNTDSPPIITSIQHYLDTPQPNSLYLN